MDYQEKRSYKFVYFVDVDVHTKFGQILSIHSPDIERNQNSDVNQGP